MSCPQCQATSPPGSGCCDHCGTALAGAGRPSPSASQFPRTPGEQFLPDSRAGRHIPGLDPRARRFRPDWRRLTRVEQASGGATLTVLVSLFLPWFGAAGPGPGASLSGTRAHGYLVIVVLLAMPMAGYLLQRSGRDRRPASRRPAANALIAVSGLLLAGVAAGWADAPAPGARWEFGAYLALTAAAAACAAALTATARRGRPGRGR